MDTNNQLAVQSIPALHSQKLIQCLVKLEVEHTRSDAKMELVSIAGELMPAGKPQFLEVIKYPMIKSLIDEHGKKTMVKVIFLLVKDFCTSLNVVRNMNEDQMIEAAAMLLDECDNFRLEDYTMMFTMAKRGELVKIYDRIDIQVITDIIDVYWEKRKNAAASVQEEQMKRLDSIGSTNRMLETMNPIDAKMITATDGLAAALEQLKSGLIDNDITPNNG